MFAGPNTIAIKLGDYLQGTAEGPLGIGGAAAHFSDRIRNSGDQAEAAVIFAVPPVSPDIRELGSKMVASAFTTCS